MGWPEAAQQTCRFGSSESFLTLESGWGELLHRYEARPDRKSVSASLKHALLTQICHTTPQGLVCRKVQHNFSSVWQLGDALGLPPLPSVLLPPADHVLGDTIGSLLQRTDTVPAIFQSSASLSIIPKKDGTRGMDRRVPYLAHKLPGTHSCLPGFDAFSPRSWEASYISQNGQYGGKVPHKPSRGFTVAHPGQARTASSPLIPGQVPFLKGSSRSGNIEPCGRFSDETETQAGRVDVELSNGNPNLESVWRSGSGPLCFSRVVPMPALVLPKFPDDSGHRYIRPSVAECKSVRVSASKADSSSPMQSEGEQCPSPSHSPILALPDLVLGANSPPVSAPLGDSKQAGPAVPASGQDLASSARDLEAVGMAHTGPRALMNNLPVEVQETIASARAPATRKLYSSKWGVFESWCFARAIDPVNCPVGPVLEFMQERLTTGADATTLRVYVAAIAARRELDEVPLGRHQMVSTFMRGVRRLRPVRPMAVPSWDLSVVLEGLVAAPFEPLESASERILTLKFTLLLVFTSLKRVGDLQALSVSEMCMDFAPGLVKVTLRPRPGYIPKVLSTSFRSQVVTLHSFHPPPLLRGRMRSLPCSAQSGHWSCMWIAPKFRENPPNCWCVLVLAAAGLPRQSRGFLTGWETPFRWLMRCVVFLHLLVFGRILLGA